MSVAAFTELDYARVALKIDRDARAVGLDPEARHLSDYLQMETSFVAGPDTTLFSLHSSQEAVRHGLSGSLKVFLKSIFFPYTFPSAAARCGISLVNFFLVKFLRKELRVFDLIKSL
jgi:hypothetical protein